MSSWGIALLTANRIVKGAVFSLLNLILFAMQPFKFFTIIFLSICKIIIKLINQQIHNFHATFSLKSLQSHISSNKC